MQKSIIELRGDIREKPFIDIIIDLRNINKNNWDKYSIYDVVSMSKDLEINFLKLSLFSLKETNVWIKNILKNMKSLNILGKKMQENKSIGFSEYIRKYINEDYEISYFEIKRDDKFHELLKP